MPYNREGEARRSCSRTSQYFPAERETLATRGKVSHGHGLGHHKPMGLVGSGLMLAGITFIGCIDTGYCYACSCVFGLVCP